MILSDDAVERIATHHEGSLEDVPFAVLLYALARAERSVKLSISRQPLVKEIVIERGVPVECRSNLSHETLSRFMQSGGLLDETTANECFAESCSRGVLFGDVLIEKGLITAEELRKVLQKNLAKKLLDGFSWLQGDYRLSDTPVRVDSTLKVNVPQLILFGVSRFATQEQVDSSIGDLVGKPLALHPEPFFSLDEIRMSPQQLSVSEALAKRPARIDELASKTEIPYEDLTRILYAFSLIGVVVTVEVIPRMKRPTRPTPPARPATKPSPKFQTTTAVPAQGTPSSPTKPAGQRRDELMEMVLNYRRRDPFELLGLDPDGFGREAHKRFLDFAERFAPWSYPDDLCEDATRVFLAGARAYGDLTNPDRRQALLEKRRSPDQKRPGAAADPFRIETDLLDPEVQFRNGRALLAEGNYREALEQLGYASDLDPQNGNYRAELAHCRYLFNPQAAGPIAISELAKALRIDPRAGLAHFYQGEILKAMDLIEEAREAYRRAIKLMAPDRRPIDALRSLPREN